jgi:hypothetical protein
MVAQETKRRQDVNRPVDREIVKRGNRRIRTRGGVARSGWIGYNDPPMRMRHLTLLLLCLGLDAAERPYVWPLPFDDGLSATFMEFRSSHLHAGIDMRTLKETGFPVLALDDGRVERIKVIVNDTGRSLFLRLADGNLAVYYHLERFSPELEKIVARLRQENGQRYFGEYALEPPLPVKRGEIIAFSGESGAGFPHLHLEIRDARERYLNPLLWLPDSSPDVNAPVIPYLLLRSRGGTRINDEVGEISLSLSKPADVWTLSEPVVVSGPFDVEVSGWDISSGRHAVAPYQVEAWLDGLPVYSLKNDSLTWDENNELGLVYDMSHSSLTRPFFNLSGQPEFTLEKSGVRLAELMQTLFPGAHHLQVRMSDISGNTAVADVPFTLQSGPAPQLSVAETDIQSAKLPVRLFIHNDDFAVCLDEWQGSAEQVGLEVSQGEMKTDLEARPKRQGIYFSFHPQPGDSLLQLRFSLKRNGERVGEILQRHTVAVLRPGQRTDLQMDGCRLSFAPACVNVPRVLLIERPPDLPAELPMLSVPVSLAPNDFAFRDTALVSFPVDYPENPGQLGIFKYNPWSRRWSWVRTGRSEPDGFFGARILVPATYALFRDSFPPRIQLGRLHTRKLAALKMILIRITDLGMGVDGNSVRVTLDGLPVDCDYDQDWYGVFVKRTDGLHKGKNRLLVTVSDYAGNRVERALALRLR